MALKNIFTAIALIFILEIHISFCFISKMACWKPSMCGECGVCLINAPKKEGYCETKFFHDLFVLNPPSCPIKDHCNHHYGKNKCLNEGICEGIFGGYFCKCKSFYHGQNCELKYDTGKFVQEVMIVYSSMQTALTYQLCLVVIKEFGDNFKLLFNNGGGESINYNKVKFQFSSPKEYCLERYDMSYQMCSILPEEKRYFLPLNLSYPIIKVGEGLISEKFLGNKTIVFGNVKRFSISIFNNLSKEFHQEYTKVVLYPEKLITDCSPDITFHNCGHDSTTAPHYFSNSNWTIISLLDTYTDCSLESDVLCTWKIWRLKFNHDGIETEPLVTFKGNNIYQYRIKPFTLKSGLYKVQLLVGAMSLQNKKLLNFANCYFEMKLLPLVVMIEGGISRTARFNEPLVLNATQTYDPNEEADSQQHLYFSWNCTSFESFCQTYTTRDRVFTVEGPFKIGGVYSFNLKVWSDNADVIPVSETQNVFITGDVKDKIILKCGRNCGFNNTVNADEMIYLEVHSENKSYTDNVQFTWMYKEECGSLRSTESIKQAGVLSNILIVKPNTLKEGSLYTFVVTGRHPQDEASIIVHVKNHSSLGNCFIFPEQGILGSTLFNITCANFSETDSNKVLLYKFYEKNVNESGLGILLGLNTNGFIHNLMLTERYIVVRIIKNNKIYAERNCTVQVTSKEPPLSIVSSFVTNLSKLEHFGNLSGRIQSISALASVIEFIPDKQPIVQKLIQLIPEKSIYEFTDLTISLAVLNKVVVKGTKGKDNQLDRVSVRDTSRLMNTLATKLVQWTLFAPALDSEIIVKEIQEAAHSLLTCADVVLYSRGITTNKSVKTQAIYNVSEIITSIKDRKVSSIMLSSLHKISQVIGCSLLPSQPEVVIKSQKFSLWIKVDQPKELSNIRISPDTNKSSIIMSRSLTKSLTNHSECIVLQIILMKEDPFKYDYKAFFLSTEVLSVRINHKNLSSSGLSINSLMKPIDLYLRVLHKNSSLISSSTMLPNPNIEADHKDFAVTVYKMEPPPYLGDCKLFVIFHGLKANLSLRVIFLQGMRPDYDMMISESHSVTIDSPDYTKSFYNYDINDFCYLGFIPGPEAKTDDIISFIFEVHYVQCLTRFHNDWINKECKVGENTTPNEIHCSCQHLSVFGGGVMVPPKKVDPILDLHLFLKINENPIAVILVSSVLIVYLILLVWTRHKDNKDILQRTVIVLEDNFPGEEWSYLVTVYTGWWIGAGTDANVAFQLFGTMGNSRVHIMRSSKRKVLKRHCDDWFLVFTPRSIGIITRLHIWHDCTGTNSDWYCTKIVVYDLLMKKDYYFPCNLWLSINEENEYPEAILYPLDTTEVLRRDKMAFDNALFGFRETHLFISIFLRHPRSSFTRSQRLSTVVCLTMLTMLTSIMFYGVADDTGTDFPLYSVNKKSVLIAMESQILTQPFLFLILFCFKKSRIIADPKKKEFELKMEEWAFIQEQKRIELERIQRMNENKKIADSTPKPAKKEYLEEVAVDDEEEEEEEEVYEEEKPPNCCKRTKNFFNDLLHKVITTKPLMPIRITEETPDSATIRKRWTFVAWALCEAFIWLCGYFVMLYGLKLDTAKAADWLKIVTIALGHAMLVLSPIKIIIFATILAVLFGKLYNVETFDCNPADAVFLDAFGNPQYLNNLIKLRSQPEYHPLSRLKIEEMRHKQKVMRRWRIVVDFVVIFTFFLLLFSSIFSWTPLYYIGNKHISNMITLSSFGGLSLQTVHNATEFHEYLYETLATAIFTPTWYNEAELSAHSVHYKTMGWLKDSVSRLIGTLRVRQQRVQEGSCSIHPYFQSSIIDCYAPLTSKTEDTKTYSDSWVDNDEEQGLHENIERWAYVDAFKSGSIDCYGKTGQHYDGGGYITALSRNMEYFVDKVALLESKEDTWLDGYSRVIFVELTFYNPNVDFYYVGIVIAERLPNGGVIASFQNHVVGMKGFYSWNTGVYLFGVLVLYFLCRVCFSFNKKGFKFFTELVSYYEIVFNVIIVTTLILYLRLLYLADALLEDLGTNGLEAFINFRNIIHIHALLNMFASFLFANTTLRLLRAIRIGRNYETFKYLFFLPIHYLYIIILPVIVIVLLTVHTISFLTNMPLQPSYKLLTMRNMFKILNNTSMYPRHKILPFFICFITIIPMGLYMVIFSHYYRVAKFYRLSTTSNFNIITFVYQQLKLAIPWLIPFLKTKKALYLEKKKSVGFKHRDKSRLRGGSESHKNIKGSQLYITQNYNYLINSLDLILIKLNDLEKSYFEENSSDEQTSSKK